MEHLNSEQLECIAMTAVKNDGLSLSCLPYKLRNPYICYAACEQNSRAMEKIPARASDTFSNVEIEIIYARAKEQEIKEHKERQLNEKLGRKVELLINQKNIPPSEIYNGELLAKEKARIDAEFEKRKPAALQLIEQGRGVALPPRQP